MFILALNSIYNHVAMCIVTVIDSLARILFKMAFIVHNYSTTTAIFN
jgi:hypothetical protein